MEHGRTIETGWCSPPSRPWPRPMATWTGRPVRRNSPEAVSHGVESVACRPSVSDAQSSSGREGRKLPRRRRAGVFPIRLHTCPRPPGPRPGPQSLPMPGSLPLKGHEAFLDRSGMLRRRPEGQLRRLSRCRADASRPGPRPLVHEMQLTPSLVARLWAKRLMAACGRQANPVCHQPTSSQRNPRLVPASPSSRSSSSGPWVSASCWSRSSRVVCGYPR